MEWSYIAELNPNFMEKRAKFLQPDMPSMDNRWASSTQPMASPTGLLNRFLDSKLVDTPGFVNPVSIAYIHAHHTTDHHHTISKTDANTLT